MSLKTLQFAINLLNGLLRRNELHTFTDEKGQIYTVTNVPPIINIAPFEDSELLANINLGSLLRPRLSVQSFPELSFVLLRHPVGDPLLARLCVDPATLVPRRFEGGWGLADDIRNAWIRLEKGLLHVSDLLMTSMECSACGTSARYAIRDQVHWPPPEDYGYRQLHQSVRAAEMSIRRAHLAFRLLIARCSLALSLWIFPAPEEDGIGVGVTRRDGETAGFVPHWVSFLEGQDVHSSWIDAICDSIITDFSINLHVGTVIDPTKCKSLAMLPVLRAANIPVFVMWHNSSEVAETGASLGFMKSFTPSLDEVRLALQHPPVGKPRVVTLCRGDQTRPLPDHSRFDDSTPPFGPYQLPGESRLDFLKRRERYREDQARQESHPQVRRRRERMAHADAGYPPFRQSRIYLWVHAQLLYPDLPPRWLGYEYRHPIPPSAYRSLWMVHPPGFRQYNPYYDEWDLWFPPGWGQSHEDRTELRLALVAPRRVQRVPSTEAAKLASRKMVAATVDNEQDLLIPTPEDRHIQRLVFPPNYHLHSWYGLRVVDTQTYDDVNYGKYAHRLPTIFAEMQDRFPTEEAIQKCISGWTWAVLERKLDSSALAHTWDLDSRHPRYLFREGVTDPRVSISMDHRRAPQRQTDNDEIGRWVQVTFRNDPATLNWSLFTSTMGALLLVRHINEAQTSADALLLLSSVGVPVRTGTFLGGPLRPVSGLPVPSVRPLRFPYRKKGQRPQLKDYDAYCQRVLEFSRRPYARAAWLKGGIVWRIMMEVTGWYPREDRAVTFQDELVRGPSGSINHYWPVTTERERSAYYDDDLLIEELDVISGVVRVFTGKHDHGVSRVL